MILDEVITITALIVPSNEQQTILLRNKARGALKKYLMGQIQGWIGSTSGIGGIPSQDKEVGQVSDEGTTMRLTVYNPT